MSGLSHTSALHTTHILSQEYHSRLWTCVSSPPLQNTPLPPSGSPLSFVPTGLPGLRRAILLVFDTQDVQSLSGILCRLQTSCLFLLSVASLGDKAILKQGSTRIKMWCVIQLYAATTNAWSNQFITKAGMCWL